MTNSNPSSDEIARVAHALWEEEGQPEGRDHEHWMRAIELIREGRGEEIVAANGGEPRPVQPGFNDTPPGVVPTPSDDAEDELKEEPGGRFAKQVAGARK